MIDKGTKTIRVLSIVSAACDRCGANIDLDDETEDESSILLHSCLYSNGGTLCWDPGYGSKYDGARVIVDLCESCVLQLLREWIDTGATIINRDTNEPFEFID